MGTSGGNDKDRSTTSTTIPILTPNVGRDTVLLASPDIKKSNSNLSYMTGLGVGSRSGGIGDGTGSSPRTYATGEDSSATEARMDENMAARENSGLSSRAHNVGGDSSATRTTDISDPRTDNGAVIGHAAGEGPDALSHIKETASGIGRTAGMNIGADSSTREHNLSGGSRISSFSEDISLTRTADTAANAASNVSDTAKVTSSCIVLTSGPGTDTTGNRTYTTSGSLPVTKANEGYDAPSHIKDVTSGIVASDTGAGSGNRDYTPSEDTSVIKSVADTAAAPCMVDTAKGGISITSGSGNSLGYGPGAPSRGDSYSIGNKADLGTAPCGYIIGSGAGFGSGNNHGTQPSRIGECAASGSRFFLGSYSESRGNSYSTSGTDVWTGLKEEGTVSNRDGAYLSGSDSFDTSKITSGLDTSRRAREERYTIMGPNLATNQDREERAQVEDPHHGPMDRQLMDHERRDRERTDCERMGRELMDRERTDRGWMGAGREQHGSLGERYIITHGGNAEMLDLGARGKHGIERDGEQLTGEGAEERRTITDGDRKVDSKGEHARGEHGGKSSTVRLDLERETSDSEQEALSIARGKNSEGTTGVSTSHKIASSPQKYSSLVSQEPKPLEFKRGPEEMGHIPGDFDSQGRYDQDPATRDAKYSARPQAKTTTQEAPHDNAQIQSGKPSHKRESLLLSPNTEQQQATRESPVERHRSAGPSRCGSFQGGGVKTTMNNLPEYREQKTDGSGAVVADEHETEHEVRVMVKSQFGDYDDDLRRKSFLGRAANRMGNLLKT